MANNTLNLILNLKDDASAGLKRFQKSIKDTSEQARKLGKAMTVTGIAIAGSLGLAVNEFANFESGMSNVKAITNSTGTEMESLTELAKEMGRTTVFTAKESADAMKFLGMAGFNTNEIMSALPGTLNLAAATGIELGRAADIASNVLTGFRLEASKTDEVIDILAATVTSSNTDMEQMAEAMKFMAPTAASFGIDVQETAAIIGKLGNAGLQGSIATRALATSMNRLADPTKKMKGKMKELNLEFFDAKGRFIGLVGSVAELEKGLEGSTDEQRAAAISTIFGQQALKQWNILLAEGSQSLNDYTEELEMSSGAAEKMADTQLDNLQGSMKLLKSAVSGLAIEIGSKLAPTLRKIADFITDVTSKMISWAEENPILADKIIAVSVAIGGILLVLGPLLLIIPGLIGFFSALSAVAGVVAAGFALLMGPVGLIIAIFAALVAAGVFVVKNWEEIKSKGLEIWGKVTSSISDAVNTAVSFVKQKWAEVQTASSIIWNGILDVITGVLNLIKDVIVFIVTFIIGSVVLFFKLFGIDIIQIFSDLFEFFKWVWNGIRDLISGILTVVSETLSAFGNTVRSIWNKTWSDAKNTTSVKWAEIKSTVSEGFSDLLQKAADFVKPLLELFDSVWKGIELGAVVAFESIISAVKGLVNSMITVLNFFIRQVNKVTAAGNVIPGVDVQQIAEIPHLAKGGIVNSPTTALIGEDGPEAVIPLSKKNNPGGIGLGSDITIIINGDVSGEDMLDKLTNNIIAELKLHSAVV